MIAVRSVKDAPIKNGTRVLLRADFDIASEGSAMEYDLRLQELKETVDLVLSGGGKLCIVSHMGRPGGKKSDALSLKKLLPIISSLYAVPFRFVDDPFNITVKKELLLSQDHFLFENIRFWPGEEKNDPQFAKELSEWGEVYINEAFATAHRAHASVVGIPEYISGFAGLHFIKEVSMLSQVLEGPQHSRVLVLGGEKIETKLMLVEHFLRQGDTVCVGGTLANTILAAKGINIGSSTMDKDAMNELDNFVLNNQNIRLPVDGIVVLSGAENNSRTTPIEEMKGEEIILDIGPETEKIYGDLIRGAKTVVWNGPLGRAEIKDFSHGTIAIAEAMQQTKGLTVVGGGHTIAALQKYNVLTGFSHISTGGGAMLQFLAGKELPGVVILKSR